jgi:hypothetical protein
VDPDERGLFQARVALNDLVCDANDGAPETFSVQQDPFRLCRRSHEPLLSGLSGPS